MELKHSLAEPRLPLTERGMCCWTSSGWRPACQAPPSTPWTGSDIAGKVKVSRSAQVYAGKAPFHRAGPARPMCVHARGVGEEFRHSGARQPRSAPSSCPTGAGPQVTVLANVRRARRRSSAARCCPRSAGSWSASSPSPDIHQDAGRRPSRGHDRVGRDARGARRPTRSRPTGRIRRAGRRCGAGQRRAGTTTWLIWPATTWPSPSRSSACRCAPQPAPRGGLVTKTPAQLLAIETSARLGRGHPAAAGRPRLSLAPATEAEVGRSRQQPCAEAMASANGSGGPEAALPGHADAAAHGEAGGARPPRRGGHRAAAAGASPGAERWSQLRQRGGRACSAWPGRCRSRGRGRRGESAIAYRRLRARAPGRRLLGR